MSPGFGFTLNRPVRPDRDAVCFLPQRGALVFDHSRPIFGQQNRKAALVAKLVHLTLQDALEQNRMKEFMAQYKGVKAGSAALGKRAKQDAGAPQPRRKKTARAR